MKHKTLVLAVVSMLAAGLVACGGGGGSGGGNVRPSPPPPPATGGDDGQQPPKPDPKPDPDPDPGQTQGPENRQPAIDAHLALTGARAAHALGYSGLGTTIGLMDTGVRRNHPGLDGRVDASFVHIDARNDLTVDDKIGHGTTVALLAAGAPVGAWPGGMAPGARIASSRIIADTPSGDDGSGQGNKVLPGRGYGDYFKALNLELADAGARILNNSWGGLYWDSPRVTDEFVDAYREFVVERGGLVVFANGNAGNDARYRSRPSDNAALPSKSAEAAVLERGWLAVAALNPTEAEPALTDYSQACGIAMRYCLTAPGNVVYPGLDAGPGDPAYMWGGGTSYAAPLVSGAAALVWEAFPYFDNDLVRQTLLGTARDIGDAGPDAVFGYGLLDAGKAVRGPARFDWGDANVALGDSDVSVWLNDIRGDGGLIKRGKGKLGLGGHGGYAGSTLVEEGMLYAFKGLSGAGLTVRPGAIFQGVGDISGDVVNAGVVVAGDGSQGMRIRGDFYNRRTPGSTESAELIVWLGAPLEVEGRAYLGTGGDASDGAGIMSVQGAIEGYVSHGRDVVLRAAEGIEGRFDMWRLFDPGPTFVSFGLEYQPNEVYFLVERSDVAATAAALGLPSPMLASAERVEMAMRTIDGHLARAAGDAVDPGFVAAAGRFQQAPNAQAAALSLRSLSGQLHGAAAAMTFESIDANRRAASGRFDRFRDGDEDAGSWAIDIARDGGLSLAGFDPVGLSTRGEAIGHDIASGRDALFGVAMSRQRQDGWLSALGDRMQGYQYESQLYAGRLDGNRYLQGRLGAGGFERRMQRNLRLGATVDGVGARLSGRYFTANLESGLSLRMAGGTLIPYLGVDHTRMENDGFQETGAGGLGLRATARNSARSQGYLGLRGERRWRPGRGVSLSVDAGAEWQRQLHSEGDLFEASFVGVEQWQPLYGIGLAERSRLYRLGLQASRSWHRLRLEYGRRASDRSEDRRLDLRYRLDF